MEFIKTNINQISIKEDTLYDIIYNLFFFAQLKESEEDIKNGRVCTLEELKKYIDGLEEIYEDSNTR